MPYQPVLVVTGSGAMGLAIARRLGAGHQILLADYSEAILSGAVETLREEGFNVTGITTDVSSYSSVTNLATQASSLGPLDCVIHTAGVCPPATNEANRILNVNLVGTANIIDAFLIVATPGMSLVCIASQGGHFISSKIPASLSAHIAKVPTPQLPIHPDLESITDPFEAYVTSKYGVQLRVQSFSKSYGAKGARLNSVSPGYIVSAMSRAMVDSPMGDIREKVMNTTAVGRLGLPEDVAGVVAFLCGRDAGYVTGTDILVDGGALGPMILGQVQNPWGAEF